MQSNSTPSFTIHNQVANSFSVIYRVSLGITEATSVTIAGALQALEEEVENLRKAREKIPGYTLHREALIKDILTVLFFENHSAEDDIPDTSETNLNKIIDNLDINHIEKLNTIITNLAYLKDHNIIAARSDGSNLASGTRSMFRRLEKVARDKKFQLECLGNNLFIADNDAKTFYQSYTQAQAAVNAHNDSTITIQEAINQLNTDEAAYREDNSLYKDFSENRKNLVSVIQGNLAGKNNSHGSEADVKQHISNLSIDELDKIIHDLSKLKQEPFVRRLDGRSGPSRTIKSLERIIYAAALRKLKISLEESYPATFDCCFSSSSFSYSSFEGALNNNAHLYNDTTPAEQDTLQPLVDHFHSYRDAIGKLDILKTHAGFWGTHENLSASRLIDAMTDVIVRKQYMSNIT